MDRSQHAATPLSSSPALLGPHSSQNQSSKSSFEQEIPLLDEVNELLEKEKTLYRLQAMEANAAAEAWKSKYENLIGDVADTAALSNYQTCEIAAGIEATSSAGTSKDEKPKIDTNTLL